MFGAAGSALITATIHSQVTGQCREAPAQTVSGRWPPCACCHGGSPAFSRRRRRCDHVALDGQAPRSRAAADKSAIEDGRSADLSVAGRATDQSHRRWARPQQVLIRCQSRSRRFDVKSQLLAILGRTSTGAWPAAAGPTYNQADGIATHPPRAQKSGARRSLPVTWIQPPRPLGLYSGCLKQRTPSDPAGRRIDGHLRSQPRSAAITGGFPTALVLRQTPTASHAVITLRRYSTASTGHYL